LLPGRSELNQIELIIDLLGTPNATIWPEFDNLPMLENIILKSQPYNNLKPKYDLFLSFINNFIQLLLCKTRKIQEYQINVGRECHGIGYFENI
jgi:uncharacterized protein (DUF1919 family)